MDITELNQIIDLLNQKKYAQRNGLSTLDNADLTAIEQQLIQTYHPEQALISYGTLAPGRPNHARVAAIQGRWQPGTIRGQLTNKGWGAELGYDGFVPSSGQDQITIAAFVLFSPVLADYWPRLDKFEGPAYERILVPFRLDTGEVGVGHLYALRTEAV